MLNARANSPSLKMVNALMRSKIVFWLQIPDQHAYSVKMENSMTQVQVDASRTTLMVVLSRTNLDVNSARKEETESLDSALRTLLLPIAKELLKEFAYNVKNTIW